MAKNLFEQLLNKAGEIWSGPKTQYDHNIYIENSSGLSGVAKYLARQEQTVKQKEAETIPANATSVEKYLARKQQGSAPQAVQEVPTTGVGKYLARQAAGGSVPVPPPVKEPVVIPATGVGKYLAGMPLTRSPAPAPEAKQAQPAKSQPGKTAAPAKKPASSATAKAEKEAAPAKPGKAAPQAVEVEESASKSAAHSGSDVIHFENVAQCQARTSKGTQCKNTNHLTKLNRTINKQKYQFVACPQHHNDTFKPYPPILETH